MNIIFDFCGVVFAWTPEAILASAEIDPALHAQVKAGLFTHPDWLALDRGTLLRDEALRHAAAHTGLPLATVAELVPLIPHALVPMPGTVALIHALKAQGHSLYYLTNLNEDCMVHLERTCPFWDVFTGGIASCRVHALKPEDAIYTALLDTYGFTGTDMLFIDDRVENLDAANGFGIKTLHFRSPVQCVADLRSRGIVL